MCAQIDCSQFHIFWCDCQDHILPSPLQTSAETTKGGGSAGERQDKNIFIPPPPPHLCDAIKPDEWPPPLPLLPPSIDAFLITEVVNTLTF